MMNKFTYVYWVIIIKIKVPKRYKKKRTTDQNDLKFERSIIENEGKHMA